jgi:hypothetical protein
LDKIRCAQQFDYSDCVLWIAPFFVISLPLSLCDGVCVWSIVIGSPPNNNSIPIYIRIWFWFVLS